MRPERPAPVPPRGDEAERFLREIAAGPSPPIDWLRRRVRERAAPRFTRWAWDWIEEDFLGDLLVQFTTTVGRPGFALRGSAVAYVDVSILNLCRSYFRQLARLRRQEPPAEELPSRGAGATRQLAAAMELWRLLRAAGPDCRRLLLYKYASGLSLEEIAEQIGTEAKTVQSRLHTCRERMRSARRERPDQREVGPRLYDGGRNR